MPYFIVSFVPCPIRETTSRTGHACCDFLFRSLSIYLSIYTRFVFYRTVPCPAQSFTLTLPLALFCCHPLALPPLNPNDFSLSLARAPLHAVLFHSRFESLNSRRVYHTYLARSIHAPSANTLGLPHSPLTRSLTHSLIFSVQVSFYLLCVVIDVRMCAM